MCLTPGGLLLKGAEHQPAHKSLPEWEHKLKTTRAITFPPISYFFYILFEHNKAIEAELSVHLTGQWQQPHISLGWSFHTKSKSKGLEEATR